ncbi:ankyrin repeat-containing domain protein [Russula dissimulans]|nr:ankyrin repeat-containing domain protein [Russula dissimulans]
MRLLLEYGASVNGWNGFEPLHAASNTGEVEAMRLLLQYNVDINTADLANWTALHWAFYHPKVIELLLGYGANVDARTVTNDTPLYMASRNGVLSSVQTLLRHGADVHIRGEGNLTPFQVATSYGHREVAQLLLRHDAAEEQVDVATGVSRGCDPVSYIIEDNYP